MQPGEHAPRNDDSRAELAARILREFAERTGITSHRPGQRYLWTDAFAVCTLQHLARAAHDARLLETALQLVDRVHHELGRHRADDGRVGWLGGLGESAGEHHPTRGGLRIGKPLPERRTGEPLNEQLEWEQDGQYFHYLTQWMCALDQVAGATRQAHFNVWARELAQTAHRAFVHRPSGAASPRLFWKMSIDLSRPLVVSMGQHDALDGWITCVQLQTSARVLEAGAAGPDLSGAAEEFAAMVSGHELATADALGLGGLLMDASRVAQLMRHGQFADGELLQTLLEAALEGLSYYSLQGELGQPAARRLAFRELGLAIGLAGSEFIGKAAPLERLSARARAELRASLAALSSYGVLAERIRAFWLSPAHQQGRSWTEHRNINEVMLSSSLAPEGVLLLTTLSQ